MKKPLTTRDFPVLEMSCASCAISVSSILKNTKGVMDAEVNYGSHTARITYDEKTVQPPALQQAVRSIGYDLVIDGEGPEDQVEKNQRERYEQIKKRTFWASLLTLPVFVMGMFFMDNPTGKWLSLALTFPVVFYFGRHFFLNAFKQARHAQANMDTLVALSTGIAFLFSAFTTLFPDYWHGQGLHAHVYFEAAAVVIVFVSLGKMLEEKAKTGTTASLKKLMGLQPKTVWVLENGAEKEIPVEKVQVGQTIIIHPGENIPVDGTVLDGHSFVDESLVTGEYVPANKNAGDPVYAGTINQQGSFRFTAVQVGQDTVLAHIIKQVQEAQASRAPVQKMVDKVAGIFVPTVMGIAALTFIAWMAIGGEQAFAHALLTSVTVLVIACPCALGLATPTAIMAGMGMGAEHHILIRDAESLERAHRITALAFDKTGTLTEGRPTVTNCHWMEEDTTQYQRILYAISSRSEHPLSGAIARSLNVNGEGGLTPEKFESVSGKGIRAFVGNEAYALGNKKWMADMGITLDDPTENLSASLGNAGKTLVYFSKGQRLLAILGIADPIKESSKKAIRQLKDMGIAVYLLTGDQEPTAKTVAREVGIDHYAASLLPEDKVAFIKNLQGQGKTVGMVGDGINDASALAQADVSMAMGKGADLAKSVARITLVSSDLILVPKAIHLSSHVVRLIRQNLFWAFIYNLIGIPLAAGVLYPINGFLLNPMIAGGAMALSSVSVVMNSLRLRHVRL